MQPKKSILLIHSPVAKPCEPPAGIARLAWALRTAGIDFLGCMASHLACKEI